MAARKLFTHRLRWIAVAAVAVCAVAAAVSWWVAGQLVSPAPRRIPARAIDLDVESVVINSDSGSPLAGWYAPGNTDKGTVVLLHSIRSSRLQMVDRARLLHRNGYSTLLIDLQAHGESPGQHITAGHLERSDARAAVRFARQRQPDQPVAIIGTSLGGAATLLASPLDIDAAILEAVYPTIGEAVDNRVRMRLGPLSPIATHVLLLQLTPRLGISPSQLRPIDHISAIGCPVLVMVGSQDRHTSPAETRRLFAAAVQPKQLAIIAGAGHVDLHHFDPMRYANIVLTFLDTHLASH